jgi:hypothetical protein
MHRTNLGGEATFDWFHVFPMLRPSPDRFRARENFDTFNEKLAPLLFSG